MQNRAINKKSANKILYLAYNAFDFLKNNIIVIVALLLFVFFVSLYVRRTFIDVPFLDGMLQLPTVDKYFQGTLSTNDIMTNQFGEHRLIGYSLIFLLNTIIFHLNMTVEPYIFLAIFTSLAVIIYFSYKSFFKKTRPNISMAWVQISYIPILAIIFSLVHPPLILMTAQFVIGVLFFVLAAIFLNKILLGDPSKKTLLFFIFFITFYIVVFSGAYFGGALFSILFCFLFSSVFTRNRKFTPALLVSIVIPILLVFIYLALTKVNQYDGNGILNKLVLFFSRPLETSKALLAGISASTLDVHTFMEKFKNNELLVLINGSVLLGLGIYSFVKFVILKVYKWSYLPLLLLTYTAGTILTIRLGRLNGGWQQPMNEWYSFHMKLYLVGVLWIIFYDLMKRYEPRESIKSFVLNNWGNLSFVSISLLFIFSLTIYSNIHLWKRGVFVRQYLEVKRRAILNPEGKNLEEILLIPNQNSQEAIEIMKKYNLSIFRK